MIAAVSTVIAAVIKVMAAVKTLRAAVSSVIAIAIAADLAVEAAVSTVWYQLFHLSN
jgi:hypothetical protein